MKILEAQSATLSNYEVYTHLRNQKAQYESTGKKRRGPGNLETVVRELLDYFDKPPNPLASKPFLYSPDTIKTLLVRLRPYRLTKAEVLMILNLRPSQTSALSVVIEEMAERFNEPEQLEIVHIIGETLGTADGQAERQAMQTGAQDARDRQIDLTDEIDDDSGS